MPFALESVLKNPRSKWMEVQGPSSDIVISSRVRLARNLTDVPFPHGLDEKSAQNLIRQVEKALQKLNADKTVRAHGEVTLFRLGEYSSLDRQVLVEKHLISPQLASKGDLAALALSEDSAVAIMINEEDHLRIQCLYPGLKLEDAWEMASHIDDLLEQDMDYAFCERRGYLTTCPTNVGTGIRASVMMHLPGLVLTNQAGRILNTLSKVGVMVRGLYGEGTEAIGNIFQVSNQITLGRSEEDIIRNLMGISRQILEHERSARQRLLNDVRNEIEDRVCRAYGILTNARILSSNEAMKLLSDLRLGIDVHILPHVRPEVFNELLVLTRPGYLQKLSGEELGPQARDLKRAALIRQRILQSGTGKPGGTR